AIDGLAAEGLLVSRQGSGNFVCTRIDKNFAKLTSFSEDMRARGRIPRSAWLKRSEGTVTPEEALKLALSPGTLVYRFHPLRFACCGSGLVDSDTAGESGSGWPGFWQPAEKESIEEKTDSSLVMPRTEVKCRQCGGHVGHVFEDGPQPAGQRYCINSMSLGFK